MDVWSVVTDILDLALNYDASTNVEKKSDIRKPYYN